MPRGEVELWHNDQLQRVVRVENAKAYITRFNASEFARANGWEATQRHFALPKIQAGKRVMSLEAFAEWLFEEYDLDVEIIPPKLEDEPLPEQVSRPEA